MHLSPTCDTGLDLMAFVIAGDLAPEQLDEFGALRTRPDDAHIASEHVDELWELVERKLAQRAADARQALIAFYPAGPHVAPDELLGCAVVCARHRLRLPVHRPELV